MTSIIEKIKSWLGLGSKATAARAQDDGDLLIGTIAHFNWNKGYGFIDCPEVPERVFLHRTKLKSRVKTGDTVQFKLGKDKRGYHAVLAFSPDRNKSNGNATPRRTGSAREA
jgi:cold shock CspA family protein